MWTYFKLQLRCRSRNSKQPEGFHLEIRDRARYCKPAVHWETTRNQVEPSEYRNGRCERKNDTIVVLNFRRLNAHALQAVNEYLT